MARNRPARKAIAIHFAATLIAAAGAVANGVGSVGDRVWMDGDGDGVQDALEAGLSGATVELLNSGNSVIATTVTGPNGTYGFTSVDPASYTVRVVSGTLSPAGMGPTYDLDGNGTPHTAAVTVGIGQNRTDVDFGYRLASVGDRVWFDADGDGAQDAGEAGINGVELQLLDSGDNPLATTTTAGDGDYSFSGVQGPATYSVRVVESSLPPGMGQTYDLDGIGGTPHKASFSLSAGQARTDVDFGYRTALLGDRVWSDSSGDGVQDAGEAGIAGVTVELLNSSSSVIATTTTGTDGIYTFSGLAAGSYTVRVVAATLPAGHTQTYDLDGTGTPHAAAVTLTAGQARTDVDFGYQVRGYFTLVPCRLVDTRNPDGPLGGPALAGSASRTFTAAGACGVPSTAKVVAVILTATQATQDGGLVVDAANQPMPVTTTLLYRAGITRANNGLVRLGANGDFKVFNFGAGSVHLIVDVFGYAE